MPLLARRRVGRGVLVALGAAALVLAGPAGPAAAAPSAPVTRCTLSDPRLAEVSGMTVTPAGPAVVDDSGNTTLVYTLAPDCSVASARPLGVTGRDVEDLARGTDGALWLADVGDNDRARTTVALIRVPPQGPAAVRRLVYPDGPHDAETLLLPADGRPVIVTKDLGGRSGVYTTDTPPSGPSPTPLRHVGELVVPLSSTEGGPVGPFGRGLVTGGALTGDGRVAAVRTYTDAWLYRVPAEGAGTADGVVDALRGTPTCVPLPGEPQGEAIAFTADGTLLSAGESPASRTGVRTASLRAVPGAAGLVPAFTAVSPAAVGSPSVPPAPTGASGSAPGAGGGPSAGLVVGGVLVGVAVLGLLLGTWIRTVRGGPRRRP